MTNTTAQKKLAEYLKKETQLQGAETQLQPDLNATSGGKFDIVDLQILQKIADQKTQKTLTEDLAPFIHKSNISRRIDRLISDKVIAPIPHTRPRCFDLTEKGFFLLNNSLGGGAETQLQTQLQKRNLPEKVPFHVEQPRVRFHRAQIVAHVLNPERIKQLPAILKERKVTYAAHNLRNWTQYTIKNFPVTDCTVQVNPRSVSIFLPEVTKPSVDEAVAHMLDTFAAITPIIENDLKLQIRGIRKVNVHVARQEIAFMQDPIAKELKRRGIKYYEVRGLDKNKVVVDNSKGVPELEFHGNAAQDNARDYEEMNKTFTPLAKDLLAGKWEQLSSYIERIPILETTQNATLKLLASSLGLTPAKIQELGKGKPAKKDLPIQKQPKITEGSEPRGYG